MKRVFSYTALLLKHEFLKKELKEVLTKLDKYQLENQALRLCNKNEEKRSIKYCNAYRIKLNEYEDLESMYSKAVKENETLKKQIDKEKKNGNKNIKS